jgi:hypothetical protein
MELSELANLRADLISESKDQNEFLDQTLALENSLKYLLDAKVIETEDYVPNYFLDESSNFKVNGYLVNESGERLLLFVVDEDSISESGDIEDYCISKRGDYEFQFNRGIRTIKSALKGEFLTGKQASDPIGALTAKLASLQGVEQFDVIEVVLVSLTATVSRKGREISPKSIYFEDSKLSISFGEGKTRKEILVVRTLVDLNFIHNVTTAQGNRQPLVVDFKKTFGYYIPVIEAAKDTNFTSYLCVLSADILADLYKRYSSRLLDRNVRSFLQFKKGKNQGLKDTIRHNPEKFIAYNNGLTITAIHAKTLTKKGELLIESLEDFQIVNGGQTTASIYFSKKDGLDISRVKVMAKINVIESMKESEIDDLISNISKFSNTQTNVSAVDLRSRSRELVELKRISKSVPSPSGKKWFFERSRGEFNTMVRMAGASGASRIKRESPTDRRFSKDHLAKVYLSWGDAPWFVKKGGEKIFRVFMESISGGKEQESTVSIDRDFYENIIAKMILVNTYTSMYGQGKNSMGQLRAAAVPYAVALLYSQTDGATSARLFDFSKIWKAEKLPEDLSEFSERLLQLSNRLIKKYSQSDDFSEYAKKEELWSAIRRSKEVREYFSLPASKKLISKYTRKVTQ